MKCEEEKVVEKVCWVYDQIAKLESLKPSKNVDMLFNQLVLTCIPPFSLDVTKLSTPLQHIRSHLITLCAQAESLLESHYSNLLASYSNPLDHLHIFPYYSNYIKLTLLEFTLLTQHLPYVPTQIAFVGSGPLPLTSILLASIHLPTTTFHNYDLDSLANSNASRLVESHPNLSSRVLFHTADILDVSDGLAHCQVVYLAALVGMAKEDKVRVIRHLANHMAPGAILMVRSAHGARAFLYPVVDTCDLQFQGFHVLTVFHPTDDVINSVVIARKCAALPLPLLLPIPNNNHNHQCCHHSPFMINSFNHDILHAQQ